MGGCRPPCTVFALVFPHNWLKVAQNGQNCVWPLRANDHFYEETR